MSEDIVSKSNDFGAVLSIIESSKGRALKAINAELINMYWNVGEYLSALCAKSSFGDKVIEEVAAYMSPTLVSDYTLKLPDKQILKDKLQELAGLALESDEE